MSALAIARAREQYLEQQIASATPQQLVTMLFGRLLVDIDRAAAAQESEAWAVAGDHLTHAQSIVAELTSSLTDAWEGSADLRAIYTYVNSRLIHANIRRDRAATIECRELVEPLRDAFAGAADLVTAQAG
ncbi:flagellar export chaperone FliS [Microbacterium suaedae]|uniref:flagellar export chaperone FliS n=1 Tax=Microbacterium suaedae TaxID=2067813 RepID=UPI000DA1C051|nr:flagellar export chaperone FliS [Microbacterium suaedae]